MKVMCPGCNQKLGTKDEFAGRRVKCPTCGEVFRLPKPEGLTQEIPVSSVLFDEDDLATIREVEDDDPTDSDVAEPAP